MRNANTTPKKLLLLPLIPALALGIVEVASRIHAPAPVAQQLQAPDPAPEFCCDTAMPA